MITLQLTEKQYRSIMTWMEFYQRFLIWQPDGNSVLWDKVCMDNEYDYETYNNWRNMTNELFFPELSPWASYWWSKTPLEYEIWREMRHQLNLRDNIDNVYTSTTLRWSWEPLIQITF